MLHSDPLIAYFDGLCEPRNPGGTGCGGWLCDQLSIKGHRTFGAGAGMTNNVAEYQAAIACLRAIYKSGWRGSVNLRGDSQLVVRHFSGQYHSELLSPLLATLRKAATCFASLTLEWVPRDQNAAADAESRRAYVETTGRQPPVREKIGLESAS